MFLVLGAASILGPLYMGCRKPMGQSYLQQNDSKQVPKVGNTQPRALGSARPLHQPPGAIPYAGGGEHPIVHRQMEHSRAQTRKISAVSESSFNSREALINGILPTSPPYTTHGIGALLLTYTAWHSPAASQCVLLAGIWASLCPSQCFHGARAALRVSPPCSTSPLRDIIFQAQRGGRCPRAECLTPLPAHSRDHSPSCWLSVGSRGAHPVQSSLGVMRGCRAQSSPARPCPCPPGGTPVVQSPGAAERGCRDRLG